MCGLNSCCFSGLSRDAAAREHWLEICLIDLDFFNDTNNSFHYIPKRFLDSKDIKYMHTSVNKHFNMFKTQMSVEEKHYLAPPAKTRPQPINSLDTI